jgi:hypothetical protein
MKLRNAANDLIGYTARVFNESSVQFWEIAPHSELIGLCLAQPGDEHVVYAPKGGVFAVDPAAAKGKTIEVRWCNPCQGQFHLAEKIDSGSSQQFMPPFQGDAMPHIKSVAQIDTLYRILDARQESGSATNEIADPSIWRLMDVPRWGDYLRPGWSIAVSTRIHLVT